MAKLVWYESDEDLGLVSRTDGLYLRAKCENFDCRWINHFQPEEERAEEKYWNVALGHAHMTGHRVNIYRSQEWTVERRADPQVEL